MMTKPIVLLNYGRAEPRKGLKNLLEAASILSKQKIGYKLYIASPVSYLRRFDLLDTYERLNLGKAVHFIHKVNPTQIDELIKESNLFIIPSLDYETFGLTIIECLGRGLPVIGTPVGAIPEILNRVDKRLVCKDVSPKSIADRIIWFSKLSKSEKTKLKRNCKKVVGENYSSEVVGEKLMQIYESLL